MNIRFHDIIVPREYETSKNGIVEKKTAWSKVGRAWPSKSGESLHFELFLIPNTRYFIQLKDNQKTEQTEEAPF